MSELNHLFADQLTPTEWEMLGLDQTVTYSYRCSRCRHEDSVPEVVIMGFAASGGCKPGQMPHLMCPQRGGPFRAVGRGRPRAAR
jgi:hypothetical protein